MTRERIDPAFFSGEPLALFARERVAAELLEIMTLCDTTTYPAPLPSDEEFEDIMRHRLPADPPENGTSWVQILSVRERQILGLQSRQALRILEHLHQFQLGGHDPEWTLVPLDWRRRVQLILGHCAVPIAWVSIATEED